MRYLSALCLVLCAALPARANEDYTETTTKSYPLAAGGLVSLANMNGNVEISSWDRNEVSVETVKFARDEETLHRIEIIVDASSDRLVIKTKHHRDEDSPWWNKDRWNNNGGVRYKLKVPASLDTLKVEVMNSNVTASHIGGNVKIKTMNGRIKADGLAANADLDTMNGEIAATFARLKGDQRVRLDTMNGSCTAIVPGDASTRITASSMNGRVHCDLPIKIERMRRHSLRGTIGGGTATLSLDSMNGALNIRAGS